MRPPPEFYIPGVPADRQEEIYGRFAATGGGSVPPIEERIYSITFELGGVGWTATVGCQLCGTRPREKKFSRRNWMDAPVFSDTEIAVIIPSHPYLIFHWGERSPWPNPFFANDVKSVTKFSA
ncbi:hypothetical protein [Sphingomonas tagetis]|jgi:hypothetical protein|nr:hypothetical protein [Sphingomonas tagetis]